MAASSASAIASTLLCWSMVSPRFTAFLADSNFATESAV